MSPKRGELTGLKLQYRVALGRHRRDNYVRRNVRMVRLPSTSGRACSPPFHTAAAQRRMLHVRAFTFTPCCAACCGHLSWQA